MKNILSIILWVFAPVLTPYGLQIGEIKTNNQTIKVVKNFILSPEWLQGASNVSGSKEYISFVDATGSPQIHKLSAIGNVTIHSIYNGEPTTQTVTNPTSANIQIQSDANTEVVLFGKITTLQFQPAPLGYTHLTSLDVSHAKSLTILNCDYNQLTSLDVSANIKLTILNCNSNQLTSLNVSTNTELAQLTCNSNQTLLTIDGIGVDKYVASGIAYAIEDATSVDGTVTLRQGDEFNQTIIETAMRKGWDVQYYS